MRRCKDQSRRIKTLAGDLAYERAVFECGSCRRSEAPLDREMGARPGEKITLALARRMGWLMGKLSFADTAEGIKEMVGVEVSAAEGQRVALEDGSRIDAMARRDEARYLEPVSPERPAPEPELKARRLVLAADAGTVLTVPGEEDKSVWCGRAFALEDRGRKGDEERGRPFIGQSLHTASAVDFEDFAQRLKALAWRAGMRQADEIALVGDGAPPLWNWAERNLPPGATMIQDFWHVVEHLAGLCREVFSEEAGSSARLERWRQALLESRVDEVIGELEEERKRRRGAKRDLLDKEIGYLRRGRHRMDYARYRAQGWPIGSGCIEASVKHLIKERFAITGARWRRGNIFALLAICVAIANKSFDQCWSLN